MSATDHPDPEPPPVTVRAIPENDSAAEPYWPTVTEIAWDIVLNATIPLGVYYVAKRFFSFNQLSALLVAATFPLLKSAYGLARRRTVDPVALLVLLGLATSIVALFISGNPRILLIRESLFTGAFGMACLLSLLLSRPLMFYFGRYFMAGQDAAKTRRFNEAWQNPEVRRAHRLITTVWGLVYLGEFAVRVILVYALSTAVVLGVTPILLGGATIVTVVWTFRYANRLRAIVSRQPQSVSGATTPW